MLSLDHWRQTAIGRANPSGVPVDNDVSPYEGLQFLDRHFFGIISAVQEFFLHPCPHRLTACIVMASTPIAVHTLLNTVAAKRCSIGLACVLASPVAMDAYDNITVQLSKKNTRFQYKLIKKGGRASEFENAIEWLCLSGIVSQVYKVEQIKKPLENYRDIDAFKIYVSDLGLLCAKKDLAANDVLYMVEELNDFKGGMAENYVNVQLTANGYKTYYWESERGAEIDFVIQRDGQLIPIEVKSADNTRAKSLKVYMETYKPAYAIKLSAKNFGFEDNKKIVPLYAAFCI